MTDLYQWIRPPLELAVRCPDCARDATFIYASVAWIHKKADREFFDKSPHFECMSEEDYNGHLKHYAVYYHKLKSISIEAVGELPDGYSIDDWAQGKHPTSVSALHARLNFGSTVCRHCGSRKKHQLDWPNDAWYQINHGDKILWAYDKSSAQNLRNFIAAKDRDIRQFRDGRFLMKIPSHFLNQKARDSVVKKLDRLLA